MTTPLAGRRPSRTKLVTNPFNGLVGAIAVLALLFLAGCSTGSDAGDSASSETDGYSGQESPDAPDAQDGAAGGDQGEAGAAAGRDSTTSAAKAPIPAMKRSVISTGTVSLRSDDVAQARRDVQRVVDAQRAMVSEENTDSDDDGATIYARLVLRVPSESFDEAMTALEEVAELRSSERSSEDVTTQVIDTDVRVRAQEASLERVEALLARADKLQQIVWIESQLTRRQADLNSLRRQQTWLADQTSLSTITVDIERTPDADAVEDEDATGFLAGLSGGWTALVGALTVSATVVGALLPFAAVLAVVGLPLVLVARRRAQRRGRASQAPTDSPTPA